MLNFDFNKSTRKCSVSQRELNRGETYYSAVLESDEGLIRVDFSEESWKGAPEDCVGWWKTSIPDLDNGKVYWAPNHVLLGYFQHVYDQNKAFDETYILALLLVRKRILQLIDTHDKENGQQLELLHRKTKTRYDVKVCNLTGERAAEIHSILAEQLFTNQVESDDNNDSIDAVTNR